MRSRTTYIFQYYIFKEVRLWETNTHLKLLWQNLSKISNAKTVEDIEAIEINYDKMDNE